MEYLEKRISYLRGLADGLELGETSREGKIMTGMIEVLDELTSEVKAVYRRLEETEEYVEAVDEDLNDVELFLFDDDDDLYENVYDDGDDDVTVYSVYDDEDDTEFYDLDDSEDAYIFETECPTCHSNYYVIEPTEDIHAVNPT